MRVWSILAIVSTIVAFPLSSEGQTNKDPLAIELLSQAGSILSSDLGSLRTMRAKGTYTRFLAPGKTATYDVAMAAVLPDQVRWDFIGSSVKTSTVIQGNGGWILVGGKKKPLALDEVTGLGFEKFPLLLVSAWLNDAKINLTDDGTAVKNNNSYRQLRATRAIAYAGTGQRGQLLEQATTTYCFFDAKTGLPVWIRYYDNPAKMGMTLAVDLQFSDLRNFSGVNVAMAVTVYLDNQIVGILQFADIQVNASVTAADFK